MYCMDPHFAVLNVDKMIPIWMENVDHCNVENHGIHSSELLYHNHGARLIT